MLRRDDTFADIHNLDHCIEYLNKSLATFGFPPGLNLYSSEPSAVVHTCNCMYALIQQRQRDVQYRLTANETRERLMSDVFRLEAEVDRLTDQLASKEREWQANVSKGLRSDREEVAITRVVPPSRQILTVLGLINMIRRQGWKTMWTVSYRNATIQN